MFATMQAVQDLLAAIYAAHAVVLEHTTPSNASLGVVGVLAGAGLLHTMPGPSLRMQAEKMGLPAWFIVCAGLLMCSTSGLYWQEPSTGLYAVALCMGGAAATAVMMPNAMHRPGGLLFSSATLAAALWAGYKTTGELETASLLLCFAFYAWGVSGRLLAPTELPKLAQFVKAKLPAKQAKEAKFTKEDDKSETTTPAAQKDEEKSAKIEVAAKAAKEKVGARKRISSPAPVPPAQIAAGGC